MEIYEIVAIALVGLGAGVVNTLVGGGTSIVLPLLILLHIDPQVANGTNRFCVAFQAAAAARAFHGRTGGSHRTTITPVVVAILGAIPGAWLATVLDPTVFRDLIGWILLVGVAFFFVPQRKKAEGRTADEEGEPERIPAVGLVVTFLMGLYGGFVGAGVGVMILLYLPRLLRLPLVRMVQVKVWMVFALSAAAGVVYLVRGQVDLAVAAPLLPSYMVGGVLGAKVALWGGEKWIRRAIAVVAGLLALSLITGLR